jgi:hypothetical protein
MPYKTIVLEFLKERHPLLHDRLRHSRRLLRTVNAYATYLKARHHAWMEGLRPARPGSNPSQISGEALELALEDLQVSLRQDFSMDANAALSLDAAMTFLRHHTPPA